MKVNRIFLETIINYKHASSKDETRPFLQTVAIRRKSNSDNIELTSCDGHIAIRSNHTVVANDLTANEGEYYLLPTSEIDSIKLFLKKYKLYNTFELTLDYPYLSLGINEAGKEELNIKLLNREYPKIDPIYDKRFDGTLDQLYLNPDFITQLRKSVYGTSKKSVIRFKFEPSSELGPLRIVAKHEGIEHCMLIMPMRRE